jgi:hypothetical protein
LTIAVRHDGSARDGSRQVARRDGVFRFAALEAVILNKTMSLVVVASALPFRAQAVPLGAVAEHGAVIANLLVGSLLGA